MIRQRRPFVETCSAIPRGISASVGHFPALRGKRNAESICGSPPGSGAVSPPIRAKRVFWRVTVELRRNANAGPGPVGVDRVCDAREQKVQSGLDGSESPRRLWLRN